MSFSEPLLNDVYPEDREHKDVVVAFNSKWDMLILRFARHLHTASSDRMQFSTRRYGYITGQLPMMSSDSKRKKEPIPTDEKTVESRLLMCLKTGAYCVERAVVVFQTFGDSLKNVTLLSILQHNQLMNILVDLAVTIFEENTCNAGLKYTQRYVFNDIPNTQLNLVKLASAVIKQHIKDSPSEESMQPIQQTLHVIKPNQSNSRIIQINTQTKVEDQMTDEEIDHYKLISVRQTLHPLHRFLRLCLDGAFIKEKEFTINSFSGGMQQYVWDIPEDVKLDCLTLHANKPVTTCIVQCTQQILNLQQLLNKQGKSKVSFKGEQDAFEWLLTDNIRLVLFANLVLCTTFDAMTKSRSTNVQKRVLNRLRNSVNDLTLYFNLLLSR